MKRAIQASITIISLFIWSQFAWAESGSRYLTTTLLPVEEKVLGENSQSTSAPESYLWVQQKPAKRIYLRFDLKGLPQVIDEFKRCSLRVVAEDYQYRPADNRENTGGDTINLTGRLPPQTPEAGPENNSIVSFDPIGRAPGKTVAIGASQGLCREIRDSFSHSDEDRYFSVILETTTDRAGGLFFSSLNYGENPSNLPRLVVEYTLGPSSLLESSSWPQHQQNPEHTGRNSWIPYRNPTGFSLAKIDIPKVNGDGGSIADYPLIFRGNIYLVWTDSDRNWLLALDYRGNELWTPVDIGAGQLQRSPAISRNGIMYVVTEKKITGYDLKQNGKRIAVYPESVDLSGKLAAYTDLTVGNDGSIFLAMRENELNYIYGFTAALKPFAKSDQLGTGADRISTVTVAADGREVFAQTPGGAVVIDISNPSNLKFIDLQREGQLSSTYFHVPQAGPAEGVMIFADYLDNANQGNIGGYTRTRRIWNSVGAFVYQPVLGFNQMVYFIQDGGLQAHKYKLSGSVEMAPDEGLKATSNLVMDGADNIYFWENGYLHGYDTDRKTLFPKQPLTSQVKDRNVDESGNPVDGPEKFLRLMLAPDGTLWTINKKGRSLYAFKPKYAAADVTLEEADITNRTVYRTTGSLAVSSLKLETGTQVLFQAQQGISFARGFAVQKGAELLCRTGF